MISGATESGESFKLLVEAAIEKAKIEIALLQWCLIKQIREFGCLIKK